MKIEELEELHKQRPYANQGQRKPSDSDFVPVRFPGDTKKTTTLALPYGFRQNLDAFLDALLEEYGIKISRNQFILRAIRFYIEHLVSGRDDKSVKYRLLTEKYFKWTRAIKKKPAPQPTIEP